MTNISILILTKNEHHDLLACLESVAWSDEIHVFDSMSTDGTVAMAEGFKIPGSRKSQNLRVRSLIYG
jgi:glycosyltransferase involved in cell wall biosynthesis